MTTGYRTMDQVDVNDIWYGGDGIRSAVDLYRMVDMPLIKALAMPWDETILKYGISEYNGFQPLGSGQRPDRKIIDVAMVIPVVQKWGYGVGTDLDTLLRSTRREVDMDMARPFSEDPEHVLRQFVKKMMVNPSTANAGYGFYNGEFATEEKITTPPSFQENTFVAGHTHYYKSGEGELDLPTITAAVHHIREHGHKGTLAGFINSAQKQELTDLASFTGSIIRSPVSDMVAINGFADTFDLLGVQWNVTEMMPSGYVLIVEVSGFEAFRPLVFFEPANLKGLNLHPGPMGDYPLIESYFDRWFGIKVMQRGAGVAIQIASGSDAYTDPTFKV